MGQIPRLLEREHELELLAAAIHRAATGQSGAVVFEGPAGIGKSALVAEARRLAAERGMQVLAAQGAPLEREFGFVARSPVRVVKYRTGAADERDGHAG